MFSVLAPPRRVLVARLLTVALLAAAVVVGAAAIAPRLVIGLLGKGRPAPRLMGVMSLSSLNSAAIHGHWANFNRAPPPLVQSCNVTTAGLGYLEISWNCP